jgi:prepilin-type N-terminal cleavage/methylation domain-containing protein
MKKAFTMVELIFVVVIIGILASILIPKFSISRDDALIAKNSEYIMGIMIEISTYITVKGESRNDLSEMSSIIETLKTQNRIIIDSSTKSAKVKIGEEMGCITIDIDSTGSTELLKTVFSPIPTDRICQMVQNFIKEKDYPLVVRGRLIKY